MCLELDPQGQALLLSLELARCHEKTMDRRGDGGTAVAVRYLRHEEVSVARHLAVGVP